MKENILVSLPYGMCFRNIVLNEALWSYLKDNYRIDLTLNNVDIQEKDKYGIENIYFTKSRNILERLLASYNHRVLHYKWVKSYLSYYLDVGLGLIMNQLYSNWLIDKEKRKKFLFWFYMNTTIIGRVVEKLFNIGPFHLPIERILKQRKYKFVIVTHPVDPESVLIANVARKLNIPVICIVLGMDNLMTYGPMLMTPDLLLLWGEEQLSDFVDYQVKYRPELGKIMVVPIGNMIYDQYIKLLSNKDKKEERNKLPNDYEIILFAAYCESHFPGQTVICQMMVDFIKSNRLRVKLMIRLRPGTDVELWNEFYKRNADNVILQKPSGITYDKSQCGGVTNLANDSKEIGTFVETIKKSSLILTASFSTIYLDALVLGKSAYILGFCQKGDSVRLQQKALISAHPHYQDWKTIYSKQELVALLSKYFIENKREQPNLKDMDLIKMQCHAADGHVGQRAVEAIDAFIKERQQ